MAKRIGRGMGEGPTRKAVLKQMRRKGVRAPFLTPKTGKIWALSFSESEYILHFNDGSGKRSHSVVFGHNGKRWELNMMMMAEPMEP